MSSQLKCISVLNSVTRSVPSDWTADSEVLITPLVSTLSLTSRPLWLPGFDLAEETAEEYTAFRLASQTLLRGAGDQDQGRAWVGIISVVSLQDVCARSYTMTSLCYSS